VVLENRKAFTNQSIDNILPCSKYYITSGRYKYYPIFNRMKDEVLSKFNGIWVAGNGRPISGRGF